MTDIPAEADALGGVPLPREQTVLFGQDGAAHTLQEAYASGRMHHGWLLAGPRGVGKATLAFRFAKFALSHPDGFEGAGAELLSASERIAGQVALGAHPNVLHLRRPYDPDRKRFKSELTVDEVRRLVGFFGTSAAAPGPRIAIVDVADEMNRNAANALLKLLEEPPAGALVLVLSHSPGLLLPTIRSRCRRLDLPPLDRTTLAAVVEAISGHAPGTLGERFFELAGGSVRRALELLDLDGLALDAEVAKLLGALPRLDRLALHELADQLAGRGGGGRFGLFVDLLRDHLARRVRAGGRPLAALAADAEAWRRIDSIVATTETLNLDRRQAVLDTVSALAEAAPR